MEWLKDVLLWVNNNYSLLIVIIALIISIYTKTKSFFSKSEKEKIEIVKREVQQRILKMITDAEVEYYDWVKAGEIKRSQVISEILIEYPVLSKVTNQEEIINWIDEEINNALITLRKIVEENKKVELESKEA